MRICQHGRFGVFHIVILLLLSVPALMGLQRYQKNQAHKAEVAAKAAALKKTAGELAAIIDLAGEYHDAVNLASATSRIALATPVQHLEDLHRRLRKIVVTGCAIGARGNLDVEMTYIEQGFIAFMQNDGEMSKITSDGMIEAAAKERKAFEAAVVDCRKEVSAFSVDSNP